VSDFDAIVVGAGLAGSVAAYELASAGKATLLIERGNYAGAKNMTGGRLYAHALKKIFPDFESEAPLERKIAHERISLMAPDSNFTIDFSSDEMEKEDRASYSVLRGPFDQWLAAKAEDAGADAVYGIPVDALVKDDAGKVCGVRAGEDEITADVVVLADGVNSLLAEQAVGYQKPPASQLAVGVKEVLELPAQTIEDRLLCDEGEGAAWLFAGDATHGNFGGGFMYTNKESISLGIVAGMEALASPENTTPVYQMLADFKEHPAIKPLIKGAKTIEYSGHIVPEGGVNIMPPLTGDGVLLAGDTAMMCINLGYMVRGMDYAIEAGRLAGINAAKALDAGDTSKSGLQGYVDAVNSSFIMQDLEHTRNAPAYLENATRMFNDYPVLVRDIMNGMFIVDGTPLEPLKTTVMGNAKKIGYLNLFHDVRGAMKAL
jgi:electron transfer flavoprotein-quinone oxidoreductase